MIRLRHIKHLNDRILNYVNGDYHDALLIGMTAKRRLREIVDISVVPLHSKKDLELPSDYYFAYRVDGDFYWATNTLSSPRFIKITKKDYAPILKLFVTLPNCALKYGVQMFVIKPGFATFIIPR